MAGFRTASRAAPPRTARFAVFAAALALGAFNLGSYWYLKRASADFVVAGRTAEAPPYQVGTVVSWNRPSPGALFGWSRPEAGGTWTDARAAALAFRLPGRPEQDLVLTADVIAFVDPHRLPVRHVDVFVNGAPAAEWRLEHDRPTQRTVPVVRGRVKDDGVVRVDFRFREVHSPAELGTGPDTRTLSMMLLQWRLDPSPGG
jgi:hypothetical protein